MDKTNPKTKPCKAILPPELQNLPELLARLEIEEYDLLLIGDGSGSVARPLGWACVAIERLDFTRRLFYGCANYGTVNNSELLAYLLPLTWYLNKTEDSPAIRHVHIITDSNYARSTGEGKFSERNNLLWTAYQLLSRGRLVLHWHWLPRDSCGANRLADAISRAARLLLQDGGVQAGVAAQTGLTLVDCCPD